MKQSKQAYQAYREKAAEYVGSGHVSRRRLREPVDANVDPGSIPLDQLNVANPQLFKEDLRLIADQGARSIVNTRPDDDTEGQPSSSDLAWAAEELGITFLQFPIDPRSISPETAAAFAKACEMLERPLIVCSLSGALSTKIWETAESA